MRRQTWLLLVLLSATISGCTQQEGPAKGLPWWAWVIIILVIFILFWLVFRSRPEEEIKTPSPVAPEEKKPAPEKEMPLETTPQQPDDLTLIEGIGPKINTILQAVGVHTFGQLAALAPERITEILTASGIRLADPKSWPEQARLAAAGEMKQLHVYQETLKGGREV
jgi:predicted flap endonuclease-1-like 5' DNA nuclease